MKPAMGAPCEAMLRVLVIVDEQNTIHGIGSDVSSTLESLAVEPYYANSLISAIRQFEAQVFDCLVLDATLQPETVLSLMPALRLYSSLPMIVIRQEAHTISRDQWFHAGAWEVLDRSILQTIGLLQVLQCATRVHQAERQTRLVKQRLKHNDRLLTSQFQAIEQQKQCIHQLNVQLAEAKQLKQQFLSIISHELRTPMNAIIGFSQVLLRQRTSVLNKHQMNLVERILSNAKHLMNLIEEMLEFSVIEAGNLRLQPCCIDLGHLIQSLVQELRTTTDQQQLRLTVQLSLKNPCVIVDPSYLQRTLSKLINNAIKFTSTGSVTIKAYELEDDRVAILVQDTGIGIHSAEIEHIFEPFRQADQSNTREYHGMGLGLSVTAALVKQMQGNISVCSKVGEGSEFRVELPRQLKKTESDFQPVSVR